MKITLSLTHRCNLACAYCYAGRTVKKDMSLDTAQKVVDFAMRITPPDQCIEFGFFGGEPLLRLDLMRDIVSYVRKQERSVCFKVTTNGTLLNQSALDFLRREHIDLCISFDGPEHVHNLKRRYENGKGSFSDVLRGLQKALEQLDNVQVNAVFGPETVEFLPETVSFFTQLGVYAIHLNPDICTSWPENIYIKLHQTYMQIAEYYIQNYQHGREIAINLIDSKTLLFLKGGYTAEDICGMGETEWGFAPSGNIYPCERFIGEDDDLSLCLGNVHTGLDLKRRCALMKLRGNGDTKCLDCEFKPYCMNWCGCTNYFMTGHTNLAGDMLCASEKALVRSAKHAFMTLSQVNNDLFIDHLMGYLWKGHQDYLVQERSRL